jgi:hypothetical protein
VVALRDGRAELIGLQEMIARLLHGGVKAKQAHVDARQSFPTALIAQLMAPLSNPGCRLVEFRLRCLRLTLRLWAAVGGEVFGGEAAVADETRSGTYSRDSCQRRAGQVVATSKPRNCLGSSARGDTKAIGRRRGGEDLPSTSGHYARVHRGFTPRSGAINVT